MQQFTIVVEYNFLLNKGFKDEGYEKSNAKTGTAGIEPTMPVLKTGVLPLNYAPRTKKLLYYELTVYYLRRSLAIRNFFLRRRKSESNLFIEDENGKEVSNWDHFCVDEFSIDNEETIWDFITNELVKTVL